jgi:hypothetical protein
MEQPNRDVVEESGRIGQHVPTVPAEEPPEIDPESGQEERAGGNAPTFHTTEPLFHGRLDFEE